MPILLIGLAIALAYFSLIHRPETLARSVMKTMPVFLFALAASQLDAPLLIVLGLLLSAGGDWALSRAGDRAFLAGLCSFALAHLCYIAVFMPEFESLRLWPLMLVMLLLAASTEMWLAPHTGRLARPVRVYVAIIGLMMISALGLPVEQWVATLGAASFVLSDLVLSVRLFRLPSDTSLSRRASEALWIFYIAGQAMITYASVSF